MTSVSYLSQGNWVRLFDDGNGNIVGSDPKFGVGTIQYNTGAVSITLGALPDVGSYILWAWGTDSHYRKDTTLSPVDGSYRTTNEEGEWVYPIPTNHAVVFDTVTIAVDGEPPLLGTAASGLRRDYWSPDVSGFVRYQNGNRDNGLEAHLTWTSLPPASSTPIAISYDRTAVEVIETETEVSVNTTKEPTIALSRVGESLSATLPEAPDPNSLQIIEATVIATYNQIASPMSLPKFRQRSIVINSPDNGASLAGELPESVVPGTLRLFNIRLEANAQVQS
jgi:hypothetical protein